jgi:hypothetical protein
MLVAGTVARRGLGAQDLFDHLGFRVGVELQVVQSPGRQSDRCSSEAPAHGADGAGPADHAAVRAALTCRRRAQAPADSVNPALIIAWDVVRRFGARLIGGPTTRTSWR